MRPARAPPAASGSARAVPCRRSRKTGAGVQSIPSWASPRASAVEGGSAPRPRSAGRSRRRSRPCGSRPRARESPAACRGASAPTRAAKAAASARPRPKVSIRARAAMRMVRSAQPWQNRRAGNGGRPGGDLPRKGMCAARNVVDRDQRFEAELLPQLRPLFAAAYRMTGNAHDAEDLVQETFLRAYRAIDRFQAGSNARAWLVTILQRVRTDAFRRRQRRPRTVELTDSRLAARGRSAGAGRARVGLRGPGARARGAARELPLGRRPARSPGAELRGDRDGARRAGRNRDVADPPRARAAARGPRAAEGGVSCDPERVTGFVDGELPEAVAAEVAAHLETCAACRAQAAAERELRARLIALPAPELPAGLEARVRRAQRPRVFPERTLRWALPLAAALVLGVWLRGHAPFVAWDLARDHDKCFSRQPLPAQVWSREPQEVEAWFARQGTRLPALPAQVGELELVGARYCPLVSLSSAPHVYYRSVAGQVSVFVVPHGVRLGERLASRGSRRPRAADADRRRRGRDRRRSPGRGRRVRASRCGRRSWPGPAVRESGSRATERGRGTGCRPGSPCRSAEDCRPRPRCSGTRARSAFRPAAWRRCPSGCS